ncbi:MAG: hypothetical protein KAH44_05400 [Oricola sp.]|jgi:heme/copper-type cytochrome/quinol oxidase subunit 4|nr:hypothetical protein [Oricola sp.]
MVDNNEDDDGELSPEEIRVAIKLFTATYVLVILLGLVAVGGVIYMGFKGTLWYLAIPAWALLWFVFRVSKRYIKNILSSLRTDADAILAEEDLNPQASPAQMQHDSSDQQVAHQHVKIRKSGPQKTIALVVSAMLTVSAFWYGIGMLLQFIF